MTYKDKDTKRDLKKERHELKHLMSEKQELKENLENIILRYKKLEDNLDIKIKDCEWTIGFYEELKEKVEAMK